MIKDWNERTEKVETNSYKTKTNGNKTNGCHCNDCKQILIIINNIVLFALKYNISHYILILNNHYNHLIIQKLNKNINYSFVKISIETLNNWNVYKIKVQLEDWY